ncbi:MULTISPECIES: MacB family efflux pump subunit [Campylobacter]|uniref:Pyoverdine export ATP-binding/permease protein PvdT n=1 Tax=Campylobacter curvus (strain 525.92) TaxID=360105 RepID=A7GYF8_CAMC5|nr:MULTISPECIES: MacB family efflux pump subunit [Campylobacter]EAU00138.1 macrolide-specific efflux protein, ATP-binding/permease protein MacB [Campylobacter curvus 525.92]MBN7288985.1 MacB family efflux pump subunit [Campylobacter curvus]MDU6827217.1 MacB family efflux pump subunit [Campylobacter sp.]
MIELKNIVKKFKVGDSDIEILHSINLSIKKGEFIAIIGQSGSGKSTLMNILGCLDSPSSGQYLLDGADISNFDSDALAKLRRNKFGFIFQRYNLLATMNALQNVALPSVYAGVDKKNREQRAHEILASLELDDKAQSLPNKLSGGQQQRVSIARALINGGEIILADEPTGALDSKSGLKVMEILVNLHKLGHTIIIVTHDPKIAEYANRVIEIKDGNIISDTTKKDEIFTAKKHDAPQKSAFVYYKDQLIESFKMSISAMLSHKLRSLLTMLGIIIGIAAVISVVALGKGSQEQILAGIRKIGTNTIDIMPGKGFGDMRSGRVKTLVISDAQMLEKQPFLESVTPNTSTSGTLTYENISLSASLRGGGSGSFDVNGLKLASGRLYDDDEVASSASVAVIDHTTKISVFPNIDPIGKIILFNKKPLRVIGVLQKDDFTFGDASTLKIYAPYTTVINKITGDKYISSITVRVKESVNAQVAEKSLTELLTIKHGKQDFFTRNSDSIKQTIEETISTMRLLISSIALISLIVGGIGVMNIMLVSVTERTKEIGIKMAIGARQSNILQQFLIEAVLLCLIGGAIGIAFSYVIGYVFNNFLEGFSMIFSNASIVVALVTSMAIGIIFGYMPAKNASKLNPIDALSRE